MGKSEPAAVAFETTSASGSANVSQIGTLHSKNTYINTQSDTSRQADKYLSKRCLESFAFNGIYARQRSIGLTSGTCSWLLEHKQYQKWLSAANTVLWVEGHPGVGKSSIMKYAIQQDTKPDQKDKLQLAFFFNARGEPDEKTFRGLLSSLLHELSIKVPACLERLIRPFKEHYESMGNLMDTWQWTLEELKTMTLDVFPTLSSYATIHVYVDALDEAESGDDILNFLEDLMAVCVQNLSLCVSCRHHPNLKRAPEFRIAVEMENGLDLKTYASSGLRGLKVGNKRKEEIRDQLQFNARGTFQWLVLVLPLVQRMVQDGESDSSIQRTINELPSDLDALYTSLMKTLDDRRRSQSLKLFQWLCFAYRPLSLSEVRHALALDQSDDWQSWEDFTGANNPAWIRDEYSLKNTIKSLSRGLVCVQRRTDKANEAIFRPVAAEDQSSEDEYDDEDDNPNGPGSDAYSYNTHFSQYLQSQAIVVFIHQSVQDYVKEKGLTLLSGSLNPGFPMQSAAHFQISRSCLHYLALCSRENDARSDPPTKYVMTNPLWMKYSVGYWYFHARELEKCDRPQDDLVQLSGWPSKTLIELWNRIWQMLPDIDKYRFGQIISDKPGAGMSLLHLCSALGIDSVVKALIQSKDTDLEAKDGDHRTALYWAAEQDQKSVVKLLLEAPNIDSNPKKGTSCETPLHIATRRGNLDIVRQLLNAKGINVNVKDYYGQTPIYLASHFGELEILQILLEQKDADIHSKTKGGRTAMYQAEAYNHIEVLAILVLHDKKQKALGLR